MRDEAGSSPLARGLLVPVAGGGGEPGIIPARAGFTSRRSPACTRSSDHPRSRGVYRAQSMRVMSPWGSSPLARGLLRLARYAEAIGGIIPARAGFTAATRLASVGARWIIPARAGFTPPRP